MIDLSGMNGVQLRTVGDDDGIREALRHPAAWLGYQEAVQRTRPSREVDCLPPEHGVLYEQARLLVAHMLLDRVTPPVWRDWRTVPPAVIGYVADRRRRCPGDLICPPPAQGRAA